MSAAFVFAPDGAELLTASAGSPAVAQMMQQIAVQLAAAHPEQPAVTTTDVVPLPADDPRGLVFNAGSLPIVLGGILAGLVVALRVRGGLDSVLATLGIAVGGGLAIAGVLQGWLGALDGSYWANAGVVSLGIAAIGLTLVGLRRAIGMAGLPLGALTILLLGNPLSGVTSAPELLPSGWSTLGQLLPPGATGYGAPVDRVLRRSGRRAAAAGPHLLGAGRGGARPLPGGVRRSTRPRPRPSRTGSSRACENGARAATPTGVAALAASAGPLSGSRGERCACGSAGRTSTAPCGRGRCAGSSW